MELDGENFEEQYDEAHQVMLALISRIDQCEETEVALANLIAARALILMAARQPA